MANDGRFPAMSRLGSRAELWIRHLSFLTSHDGQLLRAQKRRVDEREWSDTVPAPTGVMFRLTGWPEDDIADDHLRVRWLRVVSALSVMPFSYERVLDLLAQDHVHASELFVNLMVRGYIEALDDLSPSFADTQSLPRRH